MQFVPMKAIKLISLLVLGLPFFAYSQAERNCQTMEMDAFLRAQNPKLGTLDTFEQWLQRKIQTSSSLSSREVITIPVIVHVVHNGEPPGTGTNLSQTQIQSQIDVLNEDFRRLTGTPGFNNHPDGADVELEFCLATIDPEGNPLIEVGIDRINRLDKGWSAPPYSGSYVNTDIKPVTYWNPNEYLNVWTAELTGNTLGFAQFPNASGISDLSAIYGGAETDGVVIRAISFGRSGNVTTPYHLGRTATHEIGHWLGLRHMCGDGGCAEDDFCSDTPTCDGEHMGCPIGASSCGSADMIANYMDLTDDVCMNIFTQCQKTRMLTVMMNSPRRNTLANSNACSSEVPPAAWFSSNLTISCENQSVQFTDLSPNTPTSWKWTFPGGNPTASTDPNPQVIYASEGTYDVTLEVTNAFGTNTRTITDYITVNSSDPSVFFYEDFENGVPANWTIENPDNATGWELKQVGGSQSGNQAMYVNLYFYAATGARDALISPVMNVSTYGDLTFSFDHAYRRSSNSEEDSLIVYASTDGGNTYPHRLLSLAENGNNNFATGPITGGGSFTPATTSDWCFAGNNGSECKTVDLAQFQGEENFRLKFETVSDFGNNIYIDNIRLLGTCNIVSIRPDLAQQTGFVLFPNPAKDKVSLSIERLPAGPLQIRVYNMMGGEVLNRDFSFVQGNFQTELSMGFLPAATYGVKIRFKDGVIFRKIVLDAEGR